ncbi:adenylate/guanylate cyclase domain-containing protein [Pseudodesulfovibrio portus]|uniref:Adenylate cyclase n=1 Tax=Pseudodesulfovibrio portus TaxID=231439 RepID=A0ABM8ASU7_9BACT|nr:adenylate/guanylate cyclase domain-containing protein [Pseudodesulfovibrio portus]BDQ34437.1 hypothetical protein JCM14722_19790 [Pseudodesulfovibrio portus]
MTQKIRTSTHYLAAMILLTVYGGQVCPLIDTLTLAHWGTLVAAAFIPMALLRMWLLPRLLNRVAIYDQPGRQFFFDLGLFLLFGSGLAVYNTVHLGFSVFESGPKVLLGFLIFGFFSGLDLALERERANGLTIIRENISPPETVRYTSLTRKFSGFALATVFLAGTVLILTVVKDVYWLTDVNFAMEGSRAQLLIVAEIGFIMLVLSGYILLIIASYTRNIRLFFGNETSVLRKVREGDLTRRVPRLTADEFGEIAGHTNIMIDGLIERDRIKNVFGKTVSPAIAGRLMDREKQGLSLGGSIQPLAILMCDIRDFTARAEGNPPEQVIEDLNRWFTEAVEATNSHGGVVDKFIGDGILALFGLDGEMDACEKAVACARDMLARLDRLNQSLDTPISVGIGIHKGEVLAGIVGSPERLEFTVVGDPVNTAARIERMTRRLDADILVSAAAHSDLPEGREWRDFGEQSFKGKSQKIRLYGL